MAETSGFLCWIPLLLQVFAQLLGLSPAALTAAQVLRCIAPETAEIADNPEPILRAARPMWLRQAGGDMPMCAIQLELPGAEPAHHSVCDLLLSDAAGRLYGPHHTLRAVENHSSHVYLPGVCPHGLALVAGTRPRLLHESASDAAGLAKLCGRATGRLQRHAP